MISILTEKYQQLRWGYFRWRCQTSLLYKIFLALSMASITGLAAQIRVPLPWTPVPVTGQTLAVLVSGLVLGKRLGGLSQIFYIAMGVCGVPWFAGWSSGMTHLAGPTGGYIIGFVFSALFIGHIADTSMKSRDFAFISLCMLLANFLFIHGIGLVQLYLWLTLVKATPVGITELARMGTFPFIPGDIMKAMAAAALAKAILPGKNVS